MPKGMKGLPVAVPVAVCPKDAKLCPARDHALIVELVPASQIKRN